MSDKDRKERIKKIDNLIGQHPDFPKPGILFRDLFPVMRDPTVFADLVALLTEHIQENYRDVDVIVGLDARGFIYAPLVAQKMGIKFSPIRKAGKLPGETVRASYSLEYGKDEVEMQTEAIEKGQKVVILDDLLATGDHWHERPPVLKGLAFLAEGPTLECN